MRYIDGDVLAEVAAVSKRPEFLMEMLDRAITDIERSSEALLAAFDEAQWGEAKKLAHALKGVAHQMGAFRLKNLAMFTMQTDNVGLESARTKLIAEWADVIANTLKALREAKAQARPGASGQWVA